MLSHQFPLGRSTGTLGNLGNCPGEEFISVCNILKRSFVQHNYMLGMDFSP